MKIWKKLLLQTATFSAVVSAPILLSSCGSNSSIETYSDESADIDAFASVMVYYGTNSKTMSSAQKTIQEEKVEQAKAELEILKNLNPTGSDYNKFLKKLDELSGVRTAISNKSNELKTEALWIEKTGLTDGVTSYDSAYNIFWNKVASEYINQNIGYLFISKNQFLSTYKKSYLDYLSKYSTTSGLDTSNDNQTYSVFISDYLNLASLKEELLIYGYLKKSNQSSSPLFASSRVVANKKYRYFTHNVKKEVNSLWFLADYAFSE